jgi:type II secretory pathway pseudopilin PulG
MIVFITAVLAVMIIPQFSSTDDAKHSALRFNLHMIRSQIELYKVQHAGKVPLLVTFVDQMTKSTNADGKTTGSNLIYGPYFLGQLPANPFVGGNTVAAVAAPGKEPTGVVPDSAGWQYDETTGGFYPNNPEYYRTLGQ